MSVIEKYVLGSQQNIFTTDWNSIANNTYVLSSLFDNTQGGAGDGALYADLELYVSHASAVSAGCGFALWFLMAADDTNAADGSGSIVPAGEWDLFIKLRAASGAQRRVRRIALPWGKFKVLSLNKDTGQSTASSGNFLKLRPVWTAGYTT